MQFSEELKFSDAVIGDVKVKNIGGVFSLRIEIKGGLTPELAKIIGCRTAVYAKNGTPHEGFTSIEDATAGCSAFRALLQIDGLKQSIEINGDKADDVYIEKIGKDGQLRLSLRLHYTADPLPFFNYWKLVGGGAGICKITPLQQELEASDGADAELTIRHPKTGKQTTIPVPKEQIRKAFAGTNKKAKTRAAGR